MARCTCHEPLWSWMLTAWRMRNRVPLLVGVRSGFQLWAKNRKDRHT